MLALGSVDRFTHIYHMGNLFDRLKRKSRSEKSQPEAAVPPDALGDSENEPGSDARREAERKAEEAGRKWREKAEAKGEVPKEIGGPKGLEPTRYGDWEKAGRCVDF
tara:strand:+ start:265 stop:585 length:321 start_codon:yes stop_codon:yes gene_type:complete